MVRRRGLLVGLAGCLGARQAAAAAARPDADAVLLTVRVEAAPGGPLVQEMVRLTVRAIFRSQPNQVTLEPPAFADARWLPLGEDTWGQVSLGGPQRVLLERRLAWFAQRSGALEIGPFVLRATLTAPDGGRAPVERRSAPVTLAVGPAPADAPAWWLPAASLRLLNSWSIAPAALPIGAVTRRTLVIEAAGVEAAQLPALPRLDAPGVIAFARPVVARTMLTPAGPVARATYVWDIKPVSDAPATLPEIRVPWFDTAARSMREAIVPAVRVSLFDAGAAAAAPGPIRGGRPGAGQLRPGLRGIAAGAAAFLLGSAALRAPRLPIRSAMARVALAWAVRQAVRRGDVGRLRALLASASGPESVRRARAALDRHLYAAPPGPMPPTRGLAWALLTSPAATRDAGNGDDASGGPARWRGPA